MRHHKVRKTLRKKGGGEWTDPTSWDIFKKKPEQAVQDVPKVADETMKDVVTPLGGTPTQSGVPGEMSASAPAAPYLGGRRRKTRKSRKSKRKY
jgi:hypothetical protein